MSIRTVKEYQEKVAFPYLDSLVGNINGQFSDKVVKLLVATSIFNPAELPKDESLLPMAFSKYRTWLTSMARKLQLNTMV